MIDLSVNLDKIALLRNSRGKSIPNLVFFAEQALQSGADSITVHPRSDLRHILPTDVYQLAAIKNIDLNIEGNPLLKANKYYPGYLEIIKQVRPRQATLVPDSDDQLTSNSGWSEQSVIKKLPKIIAEIKKLNTQVSLFIDPEFTNFKLLKDLGVDRVELYTERLADAYNTKHQSKIWQIYQAAAINIKQANLALNAGHDLNLDNLQLATKLPYLREVSIGHALICDAILNGWQSTIVAYKQALSAKKTAV